MYTLLFKSFIFLESWSYLDFLWGLTIFLELGLDVKIFGSKIEDGFVFDMFI